MAWSMASRSVATSSQVACPWHRGQTETSCKKTCSSRTVLTTRGCPRHCKFCTFSVDPLGHRRSYAERPLASVIEELKTITADVVLFADDDFFANPKRSEELFELIADHGIDKTFVAQARIEVANHPRLLEKAAAAGLHVLLLGIESPHDAVLEQLAKGFTQQEIRQAQPGRPVRRRQSGRRRSRGRSRPS